MNQLTRTKKGLISAVILFVVYTVSVIMTQKIFLPYVSQDGMLLSLAYGAGMAGAFFFLIRTDTVARLFEWSSIVVLLIIGIAAGVTKFGLQNTDLFHQLLLLFTIGVVALFATAGFSEWTLAKPAPKENRSIQSYNNSTQYPYDNYSIPPTQNYGGYDQPTQTIPSHHNDENYPLQ